MAGSSDAKIPEATARHGSPCDLWRYVAVALVSVLAFFAAYSYALGQGGPTPQATQGSAAAQGSAASWAYTDQGRAVAPLGSSTQADTGSGGCCVGGSGGGGCCGGGAASGGAPQQKIAKNATVAGAEQVVDLTVNNGYYPNYITAKAGLPLRIKIYHPSQGGCDGTLVFPDWGVRKDLAPASRDEIVLAPAKAGTYRFTCGMGMLSGTLVLR
jgi:hypothetical protein